MRRSYFLKESERNLRRMISSSVLRKGRQTGLFCRNTLPFLTEIHPHFLQKDTFGRRCARKEGLERYTIFRYETSTSSSLIKQAQVYLKCPYIETGSIEALHLKKSVPLNHQQKKPILNLESILFLRKHRFQERVSSIAHLLQ